MKQICRRCGRGTVVASPTPFTEALIDKCVQCKNDERLTAVERLIAITHRAQQDVDRIDVLVQRACRP